jgi:glycosyltransferase involved in cell wall biosynthesis
MRIALMGTRGIPANYGGFETFYENLAPRLAARGHDVSVYNRPHQTGHRHLSHYKGVRLVHMASIPSKHLDTITHTAASVLHGLTGRYDIVYVCGVGNTPLVWIPRLAGARVVLNVDSADWKRTKWGPAAALYLRTTERYAAKLADLIVADNQAIQERYRQEHGVDAEYVPYGANILRNESTEALARFGLEPRRYVLWVGRLEPETRVEEVIEAFGRLRAPGFKLVVLGDAPFADQYKAYVRSIATEQVVFTGYCYGEAYQQLGCHAYVYVQPSPTSGTSPALLDQMAFGNAVVVRGTPTNSEVVADAGLTYDPEDPVQALAAALQLLVDDPGLTARLRRAAVERVEAAYSWDRIADHYETLFARLCGVPSGRADSRRDSLHSTTSENPCAS